MILKHRNIRTALLLIFGVLIGILTISLFFLSRVQLATNAPTMLRDLPADVERVIEGYNYREINNGVAIHISGNRVVYRGRKMLGLRSNLAKATYFETIRGNLRSNKAVVEFTASDAEWDTKPTSPLILRRGVSVSVNNRKLHNVKTARIYFRQGVVEAMGERKESFHFR